MASEAEDCLSEDTVARLVEGRLEGDDLASAERHLATCDACVRLVAAVGDAVSTSRDAPPTAPDGHEPAAHDRVSRYELLEPIGAGAMGRVWAAHDPALDRKVAVKLLHADAATPELEARLLREAKAMAKLSAPEVITVHDAGRHGDRIFIAMELVEGGTLRTWLGKEKRPWRDVLAVFVRAGRGLARAHAAGIVHRDFKPDNVLIGDDGRVRVTDFGLARGVADRDDHEGAIETADTMEADVALTRTGMLVGTPAYMAPEQLEGRTADARSDLYAFCTALYEALYGERPFEARTLGEMRRTKLEGAVPTPKAKSDVPPRIRRVLLAGLRPSAGDRFPSMDALLAALERAARPSPLPYFLGISAIAGAALLGAWGWRTHRATTPSPAPSASSANAMATCDVAACVQKNGGAPSTCRPSDGACVTIASEDCTPKFEPRDLTAGRTVWLGAMFPTKGPKAEAFGAMNADGADFARQEIAKATSALSGSQASLHVPRIALALCDDDADPMRAARHLVDDVGVPAILGFGSGKEIEDLAGSLLIGRRVLTVASLTGSPLITRIPQPPDLPRMVWRTTFSVEAEADATAAFVHDTLEPLAAASETRVTFARADTGLGLWFAEELYRRMVFNGKPAMDNGSRYQELVYSAGASDADLAAYADRVAKTSPTILVLLGASEDTARIIPAVEARGARPTYVIASDTTEIVASFIGKDADRRRRVLGITTVTRTPEARFVIRFNAAHVRQVTRSLNPGSSYDAFYVLAYATFALGDADPTGPALSRAIERLLPPGKHVETGSSDLFEALTTLSRGENVDLDGPSGSLDFDPKTGEVQSDFALLCPAIAANGTASHDVESGVVYRTATGRAEGTLSCP